MGKRQLCAVAILMASGACGITEDSTGSQDGTETTEQNVTQFSNTCQTWTSADLHTAFAGKCNAPNSTGTFRVHALFCTEPNCNWVDGPYAFINGGTSSVTRSTWATTVTYEFGPPGG